jgi:hypothetical protein
MGLLVHEPICREEVPALLVQPASNTTGKGKAILLQAWIGPEGSRKVEAPRFQENRNMKVLRLSALYHPRKYSWYSFLLEA